MEEYISNLKQSLHRHAHPENKEAMAKYMRYQFLFLGIQSVERRKLVQQHIKDYGNLKEQMDGQAIIKRLWQEEEREFQYAAIDLLEKGYAFQKGDLAFLENLITHKSWWDTVDRIAPRQLPLYYSLYPDGKYKQLKDWSQAENIWLRRSAILFQLKAKEETDSQLLFETIRQNLKSDKFFIDKAIGWALREYSKTNADQVIDFISTTPELAPLSRREGLKWLKNKKRLK